MLVTACLPLASNFILVSKSLGQLSLGQLKKKKKKKNLHIPRSVEAKKLSRGCRSFPFHDFILCRSLSEMTRIFNVVLSPSDRTGDAKPGLI